MDATLAAVFYSFWFLHLLWRGVLLVECLILDFDRSVTGVPLWGCFLWKINDANQERIMMIFQYTVDAAH